MIILWGKQDITKLKYYYRQDGIYNKKTYEKLKLKLLEYNHGLALDFGYSEHTITIDFDNKIMEGCINKKLSDEDIETIFELLERYHIFQLKSGKFWEKLNHQPLQRFDGYEWSLIFVFEGDKYWRISEGDNYPDVFVHLAQKIIDLTGKDILNVKSIKEEELKLYKKYGDEILSK